MAAEPDKRDAIRDFRFQQQGGGEVGRDGDARNINALAFFMAMARSTRSAGGGALHWQVGTRQVRCAAAKNRGARASHEVDQARDFIVTFFHAVSGTIRAIVEKRCGIDRFYFKFVRRKEEMGECELVVDFVVGVGVEDDSAADPGFEHDFSLSKKDMNLHALARRGVSSFEKGPQLIFQELGRDVRVGNLGDNRSHQRIGPLPDVDRVVGAIHLVKLGVVRLEISSFGFTSFKVLPAPKLR